jgi:uncharacterized membrane protein YcaP (DUF421 family)
MTTLWDLLGISWWETVALIIATSVLFWVFTGLVHWFGPRMRLRVSTASLALMTVIGAVTARSILGPRPTMAAGVIALVVLFFWEWVLRRSSRWWREKRHTHRKAWAIMVDGEANAEFLDRLGITERNLWIRLRRAGVTRLDDVHLAIIEADGGLTIIRRGQGIDKELLTGVVTE